MSRQSDGLIHIGEELAGESIEKLLLLIGDKEKGFKPEAMDQILNLGLDVVYPTLENAVRDDHNADLRNGAMEAFVSFGRLGVPKLIKLLEDDNEQVRNFSAVMLGDIGNREAVPALTRALRDQDVNVRHGAAEALGKIGDRSALAPLIELLKEDFWLQYPAVVALGEMRDKRAMPHLLELLENEILVIPVVDALGKIGDKRALYNLCTTLGYMGDNAIAGAVAKAIVSICAESDTLSCQENLNDSDLGAQQQVINVEGILKLKQLLRQGDSKETVSAAITLLGLLKEATALPDFFILLEYDDFLETIEKSILAMGKIAVPYLIEALSLPFENVKIVAARVINRLGDADEIIKLIPLLHDTSVHVQGESLEALKGINHDEMLPMILEMIEFGDEEISYSASEVLGSFPYFKFQHFLQKLISSSDPHKRKRAATLIGHSNNDVSPTMLYRLAKDENVAIRKQAIWALGIKTTSGAVKLLLEALSDPDEDVRIETVKTLAEYGEHAPLQEILGLLNTCEENLAYAVVGTIGRIGAELAGQALLDYLHGRSVSQRMEFLLVETLGKLGCKPASVLLMNTYLKHYDADIRRLAVQALGNMAPSNSLKDVEAACRDPHWSVRIAALHALRKIDSEKSLPAIVAALEDPDHMVRKNAVIALGETGNFNAIPILVEELIDHEMGRYAAEALRMFGRKGLTWLHRIIGGEHAAETKERVIDVIGKIGARRSVKPLMAILDDPTPSIRLAAIDALLFCFDDMLLKKLFRLKMCDGNHDVKERADLALRTLTMEKYF
jgi:HEAT repeat protein